GAGRRDLGERHQPGRRGPRSAERASAGLLRPRARSPRRPARAAPRRVRPDRRQPPVPAGERSARPSRAGDRAGRSHLRPRRRPRPVSPAARLGGGAPAPRRCRPHPVPPARPGRRARGTRCVPGQARRMTNHMEVNEMTTEARAARDAYRLLRIGFTVAPILFGLDKFFNWTVHWPDYLAPWINNI